MFIRLWGLEGNLLVDVRARRKVSSTKVTITPAETAAPSIAASIPALDTDFIDDTFFQHDGDVSQELPISKESISSGRGRGRGRGRVGGRSSSTRTVTKSSRSKKPPKPPAAMQAHQGWVVMPTIDLCDATYEYRTHLLDEILSVRLNNYITTIRGRLQEKLRLHLLELNEVNIFTLLMSSSIDYILEYTNESITQSGLPKVSPQEFRRFMGTVLLSSTFSVSNDLSWSLMEALTNNSVMPRDRFNAILQNLRGFEVMGRSANKNNAVWLDQRDLLQNLHYLEEKIFERSKNFFLILEMVVTFWMMSYFHLRQQIWSPRHYAPERLEKKVLHPTLFVIPFFRWCWECG